MSAVDFGQGSVVPAEGLGLVDELLPAGVAGEQGPLFPPVKTIDDEIAAGMCSRFTRQLNRAA